MADYYPVLKRAVGALPQAAGESRRAVYDKARQALLKQLSGYDPPLTPTEITEQRLSLEEAIRRVEAETAGASLGVDPDAHLPAPAELQRAPARQEPTLEPARVPATGTERPPAPAAAPARAPVKAPPAPEAPTPDAPNVQAAPTSAPPPRLPPAVPTGAPTGTSPRPTAPERAEAPRSGKPGPAALAARTEPRLDPPVVREDAIGSTVRAAEALGDATARGVENARQALGGTPGDARRRTPPPVEPVGLAEAGTFLDPAVPEDRGGRRRSPWLLIAAALLLVVIGAGALAWSQRAEIERLLAGPAQTVDVAVATEEAEAADDDGLGPKIDDRLPFEEPVSPDARSVTTERVTAPGEDVAAADQPAAAAPDAAAGPPQADAPATSVDPPADPSDEAPADPSAGEAPAAGAADPPAGGTTAGETPVLVAQRAMLYEEALDGAQGARHEGTVVWSFVEQPVIPGEAPVPQIRADVSVPDLGLDLTMLIRVNGDANLPASHLVELTFRPAADFPGGTIASTPGLILKASEDDRGDPLVGAVAAVNDNMFWVALSGVERDRTRNIGLMKEREWVDIFVRYGNRRRAILTFEKGAPGAQAFAEAFAAWGQ